MCKAFLQEKKWNQNKETPSFEEYLENGWMSSSGGLLLVNAYLSMSKDITKQGLESLQNYHNLLRWPSVIFRLTNDLATSTVIIITLGNTYIFSVVLSIGYLTTFGKMRDTCYEIVAG